MKRLLLSLVLAVVMMMVMGMPVMAADYQNVTVTATPLYLAITNIPSTWTLNGITGGGTISPNTTYYANPLGDTLPPSATVLVTECQFTVTCTAGATTCDLTVNSGDFSGGDANMINSDLGTNGPTTYGGYSWYEGMTYANKVIMKSTDSTAFYTVGLAGGVALGWGAEILTQTTSWAGGTSSTATMTITATQH